MNISKMQTCVHFFVLHSFIFMEILLMFSGGLDSTGAFYQLAIKEKSSLHIHHMNLKNAEKRAFVESKAVANVLGYMKNLGAKFVYSESTHEYPVYNNQFVWDADIASFMAGNICSMIPSIKYAAYGLTKTDLSPSVSSRIEKANKIFSALCNASKIYPVQHMTKKDLVEFLPKDLVNLTWSCRTPIYKNSTAITCGQCKTCKEFQSQGIEF